MSQNDNHTNSNEAATSDEDSGGLVGTTRRKMLAGTAATWGTVSIAGCGGDGGDTPSPTPTDEDTPAPDTPTDTETPQAQPENYVVTDDMGITGNVPDTAGLVSSCVSTRRFTPGSTAIWWVGVYDPATGDVLGIDTLGENGVAINIEGGPTVELGWAGDDEENAAQEWAGSWEIPMDQDPGDYNYTVEVSDSAEGNFRRVGITESTMSIVDESQFADYVVQTYTYTWEGQPEGQVFAASCGAENKFTTSMPVGYTVTIHNPATGRPVGPGTLGENTSVMIQYPNRAFPATELSWGVGDGENAEPAWSGSLTLPEDAETGTVEYDVVIADTSEGVSTTAIGWDNSVGAADETITVDGFEYPAKHLGRYTFDVIEV
jgi:hypothetical protein